MYVSRNLKAEHLTHIVGKRKRKYQYPKYKPIIGELERSRTKFLNEHKPP